RKIRRWYYRRKAADAARMLMMLDKVFIRAGYTRADRRRFWRAMIKDRGEVVKILKEVSSSTGPS
ncbi:MAG: hypothetical protein QME65_05830, partial [Candidatus Omnitrophota bacterium]|nr:hypothetical protein [Candidatus Omnitrophota bacterium]